MIWSLLTVGCYSISSLGDKFISAKMKCKPSEFTFIVSICTALWMGIMQLFTGWSFTFTKATLILLICLILWKLGEFYTSALLLQSTSAYELKAWLGINISMSYIINVLHNTYAFNPIVILFTATLLMGIYLIESSQEALMKNKLALKLLLFVGFIISKFMYGLQIGILSKSCSPSSILFIIMISIAFIQLPKISFKKIIKKDGKFIAAATRLPNAAGLLTEAMAALENIFIYALIQPMQLAILFIVSLIKKEDMNKKKIAGTFICLISIAAIAIISHT